MMRIATKYPRIAERHFEATGRQVEVIEVKGSVELAPLIGLGDGIVDLVATGRTLEENDLEVREEIVECTARFVANRVAHKLRAAEVDELTAKLREASGAMRTRRFEWEGAAQTRRGDPRAGRRSRREPVDVGPIEREVLERRRRGACCELTARFDATERPPASLRVDPALAERGAGRRSTRRCARRSSVAAANVRAVAEAQLGRAATRVELPQGQTRDRARGRRSAPPASTRRAAAPPTPPAC